jgi:DNA-directed RNA polymerase specialized sigma24 family protein
MIPLKRDVVTPAVDEVSSPQTLDHLYRSHGAWLQRALRRRFGRAVTEIAEDLVQETYLRLTPSAVAGVIERPRALLMKIASNLTLDHLRRQSVRERALARQAAPPPPTAHQSAEPLAAMELQDVIASLPEPLRDVLRAQPLRRFDIRRNRASCRPVRKDRRMAHEQGPGVVRGASEGREGIASGDVPGRPSR